MGKETFYFSHDYNARSDQKISKLLVKHGMLGYGLYWAIIETLYNNNNILEIDYDCLAYDFRSDSEIIKSIINDFGLFSFCENTFGSISVERRLNERTIKSKKAEDSANARWEKDEKDDERKKAIECLFYAIKIYDENESFIKVGITTESVSRRYSGKLKNYQYEMIFSCENTVEKCLEFEQIFKEKFKNYTPQNQFAGYLECIEMCEYEEIIKFVMQDKTFRNANIKFRNAIKESKLKQIKEEESIVKQSKKIDVPCYSDLQKECKEKIERYESTFLIEDLQNFIEHFKSVNIKEQEIKDAMKDFKLNKINNDTPVAPYTYKNYKEWFKKFITDNRARYVNVPKFRVTFIDESVDRLDLHAGFDFYWQEEYTIEFIRDKIYSGEYPPKHNLNFKSLVDEKLITTEND